MGNTRHCIDDNKLSCFDTIKLLYVSTSKYEGDWQSILHSHPFSELFMSCRAAVLLSQRAWNFRWERMIWWSSIPMCSTRRNRCPQRRLSILCWELRGFPFPLRRLPPRRRESTCRLHLVMCIEYNTQNSNIFAYLNILLEEINKKAENYETVCQNLLEVIMICMLRNNNLSIVQSSNALLNRECTQIKHYLDANYAENITLDMLASLSHMNKYYLVSMPSPNVSEFLRLRTFCKRGYRRGNRCSNPPPIRFPRYRPRSVFLHSPIFHRHLKGDRKDTDPVPECI